jgi:hypothetical protein
MISSFDLEVVEGSIPGGLSFACPNLAQPLRLEPALTSTLAFLVTYKTNQWVCVSEIARAHL